MIRVTARFAFVEAGLWLGPATGRPAGHLKVAATITGIDAPRELMRGIIAEQEFVEVTLSSPVRGVSSAGPSALHAPMERQPVASKWKNFSAGRVVQKFEKG
jgi:hypothetical protein